MRIAILGGTGDIGEGLSLRVAYHTNHEVVIGAADPERARSKAEEYAVELASRGVDRKINGFVHEMAADRGDVVVLAVPTAELGDIIDSIAPRLDADTIVVSTIVRMERDETGWHYNPPPQGSVAEFVAERVPGQTTVVGAFHNLSADRLANLDVSLDVDTLVFGDDTDAVRNVRSLVQDVDGLGTLTAGGMANAAAVESLTPLLLTLGLQNDLHDLSVKFE